MFRRRFLSALGAAGALVAPVAAAGASQPAPSAAGPKRHKQDDWLDEAPGGHRVVFDCWMADTVGETVGFVGNWIRVNKDQYGLADADLAVVLVVRHGSAPFAFNEAIWTKYGRIFAANMSANDREAHPNPSANVHAERLRGLAKQGLRLAVCNLTTRRYTQIIGKETGTDPETVYGELTAGTVAPAVFVPAGVVAVTRAQERGYALVSVG
jgi:intracellular sulfur oxidation DsrE/DsrF family protein